MIRTVMLSITLAASAAGASEADPAADLPPTALVEKALAAYPPVRAAREGVVLELAGRRRLEAGPYEFAIRGGYQNHSLPAGRFSEVEIGIERPIRLPDKARIDVELGDQNVELARRASYSAWCDGARHLLQLWYGWARENVQLALWSQQLQALNEQASIVRRRAAAGDAPRVEANLAEASAAQAEAVVENYRGREQGARAALERTFPAVPVPGIASVGRPQPLDQSLDWFVDRVRAHNDEVRLARAASRRGLLVAKRAHAEQRPDPAVGVRLANDRSASDRIASVYVVVPLPGEARRALADGARAQAAVAASHEAAVVQRVSADVARMHGEARGAFNAWEKARSAAEGMQRNAESMNRSWQLREASLSEVLVARRLALESALAAAMARIEAEETRYRLLVEAHVLWNDPEEEAEEHKD
ncbi:MAG: TolC family protein [Betaproteobacteria bacterium]|nr:TolC family protein [Betaproteobacteria bacterium]